MDKKTIFQAAAIAALVALVGVIIQLIAGSSLPKGMTAQPETFVAPADFLAASTSYPDTTLMFFGGDTLFLLSYLMLFVGLYRLTSEQARPFALVGLGAGILTALFDTIENAFFVLLAHATKAGVPFQPESPQLPGLMIALSIITSLKWVVAFVTLYAFGLSFPRRNWFEWFITFIMMLFPLVGVVGVANPSWIALRGLFFLVGMPIFAFYFWQQSRAASAA